MSTKRILITGGAGFVGCNAARFFRARNWAVTVLDNLSRQGTENNLQWLRDNTSFEFERVDIRDRASVDRVVSEQRYDAVLHLAAQVRLLGGKFPPPRQKRLAKQVVGVGLFFGAGKAGQELQDGGDRHVDLATGVDDGHAADVFFVVNPHRPHAGGGQQTLLLVKMQGAVGDAEGIGHVGDRQRGRRVVMGKGKDGQEAAAVGRGEHAFVFPVVSRHIDCPRFTGRAYPARCRCNV